MKSDSNNASRRRTPRAKLDISASRRLISSALGKRMSNSTSNASNSHRTPTTSRRWEGADIDAEGYIDGKGESQEQSMDVDSDASDDASGSTSSYDGDDKDTANQNATVARVEAATKNLTAILRRYVDEEEGDDDQQDIDAADNDAAERKNPLIFFEDIHRAREQLFAAWEDQQDEKEERDTSGEKPRPTTSTDRDDEEFRALYMDTVTTAFAAELDDIRTGRSRVAAKSSSGRLSKRKKGKQKGDDSDDKRKEESIFVDPEHYKNKGVDAEMEDSLQTEDIDVGVLIDCLHAGMSAFTEEERAMLTEESRRRKKGGDEGETSVGLTLHERRRKLLGFAPYAC